MCRKPSKPHQLPATSSNTFFQQLIKQISVEFACANHCHQGTKASAWQMHAIPTHFADCIVGQVVHSPHILLAGGNSLSHSFRLLLRLQYLYDVQQKTNLYIRISFGDMHDNIGPRCGTKVIRSSGKAWVAQGGNHLFGSPEAFLFVTPWKKASIVFQIANRCNLPCNVFFSLGSIFCCLLSKSSKPPCKSLFFCRSQGSVTNPEIVCQGKPPCTSHKTCSQMGSCGTHDQDSQNS